jgi:hypothetical protein
MIRYHNNPYNITLQQTWGYKSIDGIDLVAAAGLLESATVPAEAPSS